MVFLGPTWAAEGFQRELFFPLARAASGAPTIKGYFVGQLLAILHFLHPHLPLSYKTPPLYQVLSTHSIPLPYSTSPETNDYTETDTPYINHTQTLQRPLSNHCFSLVSYSRLVSCTLARLPRLLARDTQTLWP